MKLMVITSITQGKIYMYLVQTDYYVKLQISLAKLLHTPYIYKKKVYSLLLIFLGCRAVNHPANLLY